VTENEAGISLDHFRRLRIRRRETKILFIKTSAVEALFLAHALTRH